MVKLYEVLKDITPLTYTGYYVEVPSLGCIKDYGQNYITKHNIHNIRRLTNQEQYEYVATAALSPTKLCHDISDANGFMTCLSSCSKDHLYDCSVTLQYNAPITLTSDVSYNNINLTIRANHVDFTHGVSNDDWIGIEVSGANISLNKLDICGVNLSIHDSSSSQSALTCASGLIIREGIHSFYNNRTSGEGGAISSGNNMHLIDASITFRHNYSNQDGGAIYTEESLTVTGDKTNLIFYDNSAVGVGGAILSENHIDIKI